VKDTADDGEEDTKMSVRVLVPLDGSALSEKAIRFGAAVASREDAALRLVHVHIPHTPTDFLGATQYQYQGVDMEEYDRRDREKEATYLSELAETVGARVGRTVPAVVIDGDVSRAIDDYAKKEGSNLIVLSTHGRSGLDRMWLGSRAEALLRHTDHAVLLVPARDYENPSDTASIDRILIALGGGELGETILPRALELAKVTRAAVTLAHVVSLGVSVGARTTPFAAGRLEQRTNAASEYLQERAENLRDQGFEVDVRVEEGTSVARTLLDLAERTESDVIAMATHAYRPLNRFVLGSVADKVIRGSPVPVLVQHPPKGA
jgi:nucleotide-binding universal stress UspA family protein